MLQLHCSGGIQVYPIGKLKNLVLGYPPFQSTWTAPILCFLSENPCLTVCLIEHKVRFETERLLYLLYDHHGTIQKNFIQDLANFLSFSLSFPPLKTIVGLSNGHLSHLSD